MKKPLLIKKGIALLTAAVIATGGTVSAYALTSQTETTVQAQTMSSDTGIEAFMTEDGKFNPTLEQLWSTDLLDSKYHIQSLTFDGFTEADREKILEAIKIYTATWQMKTFSVTITMTPEEFKNFSGYDEHEDLTTIADFFHAYLQDIHDEAINWYKEMDDTYWSYMMLSRSFGIQSYVQFQASDNPYNSHQGKTKIVLEYQGNVKSTFEQEKAAREKVDSFYAPGGIFYEYRKENDLKTDYEKLVNAYKWLVDNVSYGAIDNSSYTGYTSYGALIEGKAVCNGFSTALGLLLQRAGVDMRCIFGATTSNHAWNWVRIGEVWYGSDSTNGAAGMMLWPIKNDKYNYYHIDPDFVKDDYPQATERYEYEWLNKTYEQLEATDSGSIGSNLKWTLKDGVLKIYGTGAMRDFDSPDQVPWKNFLDEGEITRLEVADTVTRIGNNAFYNVSALSYADYKDALANMEIGDKAFKDSPENPTNPGDNLDEEKAAAIDTINALQYLTDKESYIQQVQNAKTQEEINQIVADAQNKDSELKQQAVNAAKQTALEELNKLDALSEERKQHFTSAITSAQEIAQIQALSEEAKQENSQALEQLKTDALNTLSGYHYLTEEQVTSFTNRLNSASTAADISSILQEANTANESNKESALAEKRAAAKAELDKLEYLDSTKISQYKSEIDNADSETLIDDIVTRAKAENETEKNRVLTEKRNEAKQIVAGLEYLEEERKEQLNAEIDAAQTEQEIQAVADKAIQENETNKAQILAQEKEAAKQELSKLTYLGEQSQDFADRIDAADSKTAIDQILEEARQENDRLQKLAVDAARTQALETLKTLNYLDSNTQQSYIQKLNAATSEQEIQDLLAEAEQINETNKQAVLAEKRKTASEAVNACKYLSDDEKAAFLETIAQADSEDAIDQAAEAAQAKNNENKAALLAEKQAQAKQDLASLVYLTEEQKRSFTSEIDSAQEPEAIDGIIERARQTNEEQQQTLIGKKAQAKATLNTFTYLSPDVLENYKTQVDNASSVQDIDNIVLEAQQKNEEERQKVLTEKREAAKLVLEGLTYLEDTRRQEYLNELNTADSEEAIDDIVARAEKENEDAKQEQLTAKRAEAIQKLEELTYLGDKKQQYIDEINAADTEQKIDQLVAEAQQENEELKKQAIENARTQALETLNTLTYLGDAKQEYVQKITNAATEQEIETFLNQAKAENETKKQQAIAAKREEAKQQLDTLSYLTPEEKAEYTEQIENADSEDAITQIMSDAEAANAKNKADLLAQEQAKAKEHLETLQYLTPEQKNDFIAKIEAEQEPAAISGIMEQADAINEQQKQQALDAKKEQALISLENLDYLEADAKQNYSNSINAATTEQEIDNILAQAQTENEAKKQEILNAAREDAKRQLNTCTHLGSEKMQSYLEQIESANSVDEITNLVEAALRENEALKAQALADKKAEAKQILNTFTYLGTEKIQNYSNHVDSLQTIDEIDAFLQQAQQENDQLKAQADALNAKKSEAKNALSSMTRLSNTQRQAYEARVDAADTIEAIDTILIEAKAENDRLDAIAVLEEAKTNAKATIDTLTYLPEADVLQYKQSIDSATDTMMIDSIIAQAQAQNSQLQEAARLVQKKAEATEELNTMSYLDSAAVQKYRTQIENSQTVADVEAVLLQARNENNTLEAADQLKTAKAQAKASLQQFVYLSPNMLQSYQNQIEAAASVAAVNNILEQANTENTQLHQQKQLADSKEQAKTVVNGLTTFSESEKNQLIQQIEQAQTVSAIQAIIEDVQAKEQQNLNQSPAQDNNNSANMVNQADSEQNTMNAPQTGDQISFYPLFILPASAVVIGILILIRFIRKTTKE